MKTICGKCRHYTRRPYNENVCALTGRIVGPLWERPCYEPHQNEEETMSKEIETVSEKTNAATKVCKKCGRELPLNMFRTKPNGEPYDTCKECIGAAMSAVRKGKAGKASEPKPEKAAKAAETAAKPMTDDELVAELRARGWDVKCTKTIEL